MTTPEDQLKTIIQEATAAMIATAMRMDRLAEETTGLQTHFDKEFQRLESQMGTMNAHLDNIVREVSIANGHHDTTNRLLEEDIKDRKEGRKRQYELEAAALEHQRRLETDEIQDEREEREAVRQDKRELRETLREGGRELWSIMKNPLGYLVAAAIGYAAWSFFGTSPPQAQSLQPPVTTQVEANE